jgi:hypothetical protein
LAISETACHAPFDAFQTMRKKWFKPLEFMAKERMRADK